MSRSRSSSGNRRKGGAARTGSRVRPEQGSAGRAQVPSPPAIVPASEAALANTVRANSSDEDSAEQLAEDSFQRTTRQLIRFGQEKRDERRERGVGSNHRWLALLWSGVALSAITATVAWLIGGSR